MTEVAYIDRAVATQNGLIHGFTLDTGPLRDELVGQVKWAKRNRKLERDKTKLQLIPYVVLRRPESIFCMERLKGGTEERLHGLISIGAGGHVEPVDLEGGDDLLLNCAWREVEEECEVLHAGDSPQMIYQGLLYDTSTDVSSVHLGVVYTLRVSDARVREKNALRGFWMRQMRLKMLLIQQSDRIENWSRVLIRHLGRMSTTSDKGLT